MEAVKYYHKVLHLGCCSSPRSVSVHVLGIYLKNDICFSSFYNNSVQKFLCVFQSDYLTSDLVLLTRLFSQDLTMMAFLNVFVKKRLLHL